MKLFIKISIVIVVLLGILYLGFCAYVLLTGKEMVVKNLAALTQKEVNIESFEIGFPLDFMLKKLEIKDLLKVDYIYASVSVPSLLSRKIIFNKIRFSAPELKLQRLPEEAAQPAEKTDAPGPVTVAPAIPDTKTKMNKLSRVACKHIVINDGRVDFLDLTTGEKGIKILVKDISFDLTNLYFFPRQAVSNFSLKARIPWVEGQEKEKDGTLEASGWVDIFKKDMQAALKIQNIDGIYLYPYYSTWVDLEKARIEKAKLDFTSDIHGLNNDIAADCHLELSDIVRRPLASEEQDSKAARITDAVLEIFKALNQGKIVLDFTIHTKLDKPQFGFSDIQGAVEDKIAVARREGGLNAQDVLGFPKKLLEGTVKGATDLSKALIDGTVSVGRELKNAVLVAFKKTSPEPQPQGQNTEEENKEK